MTYSLLNFFGSLVIIAVIMIILSDNTIYSVLFLIGAFLGSMCILLLLNIDYLALMFILIYVGAITILFLFVVMMLKIKINEKKSTSFFSFINVIIFCTVIYNVIFNVEFLNIFLNQDLIYIDWFSKLSYIDNVRMLGQVLYNNYYFYVLISGFILLVGMLSSILLSKESNKTVRRYQLVYQQLSRNVSNAVFSSY